MSLSSFAYAKDLEAVVKEYNKKAKNLDHYIKEEYAKSHRVHTFKRESSLQKKISHCKKAFVEAIWRTLLQPRKVQKAEQTLVRVSDKLKMNSFLH